MKYPTNAFYALFRKQFQRLILIKRYNLNTLFNFSSSRLAIIDIVRRITNQIFLTKASDLVVADGARSMLVNRCVFYKTRKSTMQFQKGTVFLSSLAVNLLIFFMFTASSAYAATYYVDATTGDDSNNGTTVDTPWKTISKVNNETFSPGDEILFKKGEQWREQLTVPSSGSDGNPIVFGSYGTGDNPKILRTELYTNWTERGIFTNGGFEQFTGTKDDGTTDTFTGWTNLVDNGNTVEATDTSNSGLTAAKVTKVTSTTSNAMIRRTGITVDPSTTYYLEFYGKRESGSDECRTAVKDNTNDEYLFEDGTWSENIGGDLYVPESLRVTESDWTQKSVSFTTQANTTTLWLQFEIKYNALATCLWDDVYLREGSSKSSERVWEGQLADVERSFGLVDDGTRRPVHYRFSDDDPLDIADGYFYNEFNSSYFYYRKDSGKPTLSEVGARQFGIYISGESYITIDGIDVFGPGGNSSVDNDQYSGIRIDSSSSNITIKNLTITNTDKNGIRSANTTSNVDYDNLTAYDNGSTGIYNNSSSGSVLNSTAYDNGRVVSDDGDRGGIGSYQGANLLISNNEVYRNGQDNSNADYEISVVAATDVMTITKNHVYECGQGCVTIAEGGDGSDGSIISYNIIEGWGTTEHTGETWGKFSGIRIAGGGIGANVNIYNNLIANGGTHISNSRGGVSIRFSGSNGTVVKNNIFYNTVNRSIQVFDDVSPSANQYDNNTYFPASYTDSWYWKGTAYSTLAEWQAASNQDANSNTSDPEFVDADGADYHLTATSPLIDAGVDVSLTSDYGGTVVPQGSAPDIGIYEYTTTPTPTPSDSTSSTTSSSDSSASFICNDQPPGAKAPWLYGAITESSSAISIFFTEPDGPFDHYVLRYGTKSGEYQYGLQSFGDTEKERQSFLVELLSPNTTYYFQVRGGNGCGVGNWSNEVEATTEALISTNQLDLHTTPEASTPEDQQTQNPTPDTRNITNQGNPNLTSGPDNTLKKNMEPETTDKETQTVYRVTINVYNKEKKAVAGAKVTLYPSEQELVTDQDGVVVFEGIKTGDHKLVATKYFSTNEQAFHLSGGVKEVTLNMEVSDRFELLFPIVLITIGVLVLFIIIFLLYYYYRNREKITNLI